MSGDDQPWFPQLAGPSGHIQPRAATAWMRLKIGRLLASSQLSGSGPSRCWRSNQGHPQAVRMVAELAPNYPSQYSAICAVAEELGMGTAEMLRKWVGRAAASTESFAHQ